MFEVSQERIPAAKHSRVTLPPNPWTEDMSAASMTVSHTLHSPIPQKFSCLRRIFFLLQSLNPPHKQINYESTNELTQHDYPGCSGEYLRALGAWRKDPRALWDRQYQRSNFTSCDHGIAEYCSWIERYELVIAAFTRFRPTHISCSSYIVGQTGWRCLSDAFWLCQMPMRDRASI